MSNLKSVIEVLLLASECPLSEKKITDILEVEQHAVRQLLSELQNDCRQRGVELIEVASGYRFQVRKAMAPWIQKND